MGHDLITRFFPHLAVDIEQAHADDLIERLHAHGAGIHAQSATHGTGDTFHPLEPTDTGGAGGGRQFLESRPHSSFQAIVTHDPNRRKFPLGGMNDRAANAAVTHQQIRPPPDEANGNPSVPQMPHQPLESRHRARLDPKLRGTADPHGGMTAHRLMQSKHRLGFMTRSHRPRSFRHPQRTLSAQRGFHLLEQAQVRRQPRARLMDVPRPQRDHQVPGPQKISNRHMGRRHLRRGKRPHLRRRRPNRLNNRFPTDPRNRRLARRIHVGHKNRVGPSKGRTKLLLQQQGARIPVRLKKDHQSLRLQRPRRRQGRRHLRWMMPIVINHPVSRTAVFHLKPPLGPPKPFQRHPDFFETHPPLHRHRHGRQRVRNIMTPRDIQHQLA